MASLRIISGTLGGRILRLPNVLDVRPTMDKTKEALFNILQHRLQFEGLEVLDLCCGTGNISLECFSRGASKICSVDVSKHCVAALKKRYQEFEVSEGSVVQADMAKFVNQHTETYDFIFMDPPYEFPKQPEIVQAIFDRKLLNPKGILVLEHKATLAVTHLPNFVESRTYGYSVLSFFENV